MPLVTPWAEVDVRTAAEVEHEAANKRAVAAAVDEAYAAWDAAGGEVDGLDGMAAEEYVALGVALRARMEEVLSEEAMEAGLQKFREVQGVGDGGFAGVWVARGSAATRKRYVAALRGVAADLLMAAKSLEAAMSVAERRRALEAVRRAAPRGWTRWLVILLAKPGKALDVLSKRRDIYLGGAAGAAETGGDRLACRCRVGAHGVARTVSNDCLAATLHHAPTSPLPPHRCHRRF